MRLYLRSSLFSEVHLEAVLLQALLCYTEQ